MNNGNICVSICGKTADETIDKIKSAEQWSDLIEVRFDCISRDELQLAASSICSSVPLLATYRPPEQGGNGIAALEERQAFWTAIRQKGYSVIDLEEDIFGSVSTRVKRILSFHDHGGVPADIDEIVSRMRSTNADFIKIAVRVDDACDAVPLWNLLKEDPRVLPIGMGEAGKWTRILGLAHGAYLTYASLDAGSETADGQVTARDLIGTYRVKDLNLATRVYGVIGHPVSESKSPYLHNPAFAAACINSVFIPLQVQDLDAFIGRMVKPETREVELNFAGFSVTMPHKRAIMPHLHEIDPVARSVGAVNTVKVEGGKLLGYNTDVLGFITPLMEHLGSISGSNVAVVGAGGAARACVYALKMGGADVTLFARDRNKASELGGKFGVNTVSLFDAKPSDFDIVVNATPVGMKPGDASLFTANELAGTKFVYDLVTRTADTPLIAEARMAGVPAIGGLEMLIAQAEMQFEIWTGQSPRPGLMGAAIAQRVGGK